jgi:hypothetical protein
MIPSSAPVTTRPKPVAGLEPMNVLAHAPVGEWARYTLAGGFEQRLEIVKSSDREVQLKLEMWLNGRPVGLPATRTEPPDVDWALRSAGTSKAHVTAAQTTLTAVGRTWATRLTLARWIYEGINYERRTWTAADGPIYGVIRMVMTADDKLAASMELVAFGSAPKDQPAPR